MGMCRRYAPFVRGNYADKRLALSGIVECMPSIAAFKCAAPNVPPRAFEHTLDLAATNDRGRVFRQSDMGRQRACSRGQLAIRCKIIVQYTM
jgi:hypothetical protein